MTDLREDRSEIRVTTLPVNRVSPAGGAEDRPNAIG